MNEYGGIGEVYHSEKKCPISSLCTKNFSLIGKDHILASAPTGRYLTAGDVGRSKIYLLRGAFKF